MTISPVALSDWSEIVILRESVRATEGSRGIARDCFVVALGDFSQ